ncbi:16S rRNA (adenine(1408)-N(1))-methyltransferase KamB [Actinokineospora globicatena]|uniref:16S rRNA (adenine(1408)-N(1))-methyltransferase KamB n=2 Tax=Actinokineospora globicatena TaxID=103729 RepID=UPI0020A2F8D6|nr:16S rRNA (adenine(1408)-N(1))-methyltransferase KamB [Actinokineospora globicatena]MCP2305186.1 16S rRNA (adenine(1408)-N(1))-methyltransferase [Actinokineospora globicatena]
MPSPMRRVTGKQVEVVEPGAFADLRSRYSGAVLDVGTGDGKHALHLAKAHPELLVIGLDAAKDNMRKSATKASAAPKKGGLPNLLYLWAAAEQLPELTGITELHVLMPWGSLLRGVLGSDPAMLAGLAGTCAPDARFLIALNLHAWRPPVPEVGTHAEPTPESAVAELGPALKAANWHLDAAEYMAAEAIAALATSWTRRLNSSRDQLDVLALTGRINPA